MLAPTTCSSGMTIMTALATNAKRCFQCVYVNQPVQGLCFRSRLVASTPEVLDNLATKDVHMLQGAIRKSEKISPTLRFQRTLYIYCIYIYILYIYTVYIYINIYIYCLISLQLPSMKVWYTMLQYGQYISYVSWFQACLFGFFRERSKREKPKTLPLENHKKTNQPIPIKVESVTQLKLNQVVNQINTRPDYLIQQPRNIPLIWCWIMLTVIISRNINTYLWGQFVKNTSNFLREYFSKYRCGKWDTT